MYLNRLNFLKNDFNSKQYASEFGEQLHFFINSPIFKFEPRVAIKLPKTKLKVAMKYFWNRGSRWLLSFFYHLRLICKKTGKIRQSLRFQAQRLLRISDLRLESCLPCCYDFRKFEARRVENGVKNV